MQQSSIKESKNKISAPKIQALPYQRISFATSLKFNPGYSSTIYYQDQLLALNFDYYNMRPYQPIQPTFVNRPINTLPTIIQQFRALDFQNRQLLKLAQNVQRSTFISNGPPPQIIYRLEQDLRRNLSVLIEGIRQVFMDMDRRLRALGQAIQQQQINQNAMQTNKSFQYPHQNLQRHRDNTFYTTQSSVDPYYSLVQRISSLQMSLKNTQQNQAKLIAKIQRMERRAQDQPSITSELKNQLQGKLQKNLSTHHIDKSSSLSENSFRIFALRSQVPSQSQNMTHHVLQNRNLSVDFSKAKIKTNERETMIMNKPRRQSITMHPFYCLGETQPESLQPSRIQPQYSGVNYQKNYASTHSHRLNFMMSTLNS